MAQDPEAASATIAWVEGRVGSAIVDALGAMFQQVVDVVSVAAGDAATLRALSADRQWLLPLAAFHPESRISREMMDAMQQTTLSATVGLWHDVVEHGATVVWNITRDGLPQEASAAQRAFLTTHRVTRVLATPVVRDGQVVGGMSLVRFVTDRDFSDTERTMLQNVADQVGRAIDFTEVARLVAAHLPDM